MSARTAGRWLLTGIFAAVLSPAIAALLTVPGAQGANPPNPSVSFANVSTPLIGQNVTFDIDFVNLQPSSTGYGPYVDLRLPKGADGDDGLTFSTATYLGAAVTSTSLVVPVGGCITHPYALQVSGAPVQVCGLIVGQSYIVLRMPFGSFTPGQPAATVHVTTLLSNKADAGAALDIKANGGFQFGADALNNPTAPDPSILGSVVTTTVSPTVMRITKTYNGPEDETATGANYPRSYTIRVTVAPGQTVTNLIVADSLPNNVQYVSTVTPTSPVSTPVLTPSTSTPGGTLSMNFGSVLGTGGTDATFTFNFYIPLNSSVPAAVLNAATGAFNTSVDSVRADGTWAPIDVRDTTGPVSAGPVTHTLTDKSIAVQKSVSRYPTPGAVAPGDILQWTISVQVSDYFALNTVVIDDLLGDGTRVDGSFVPTLQVNGNGTGFPSATAALNNANYTVSAVTGQGKTPISFRLSNELITRNVGTGGRMVGGCIDSAGGSATPNCATQNHGATVATIVFRSIVQQTYVGGTLQVVEGDTLYNDAAATATVLGTALPFTSTGNTIGDGSSGVATAGTSASISIDRGALSKSIYAINESTTFTQPVHISPGDRLTYRLTQTFPTSRTDEFVMTDFLPLPVFYAAAVTQFDRDAPLGTVPAAGHANYGPSDDFHTKVSDDLRKAPTPVVSSQVAANSVTLTYGDYALYPPAPSVADILFTVTVSTDPFADGLLLTNQARSQTKNAVGTIQTADAIVQITLDQPVVNITKGVVGTDNTTGIYTPATIGPVGVAFAAPGAPPTITDCSTSYTGGPITTAGLTAHPIDSNLSHVDAGDYVRFAITLHNTGHANAFGVKVKDNLPAGFVAPAGGIDLCIVNGAGVAVGHSDIGSGLLNQGIQLDDTASGSLAAGVSSGGVTNTAGTNVVLVTYTLQVATSAVPSGVITNTASLIDFTNAPATSGHLASPLTDTATVTMAPPAAAKVMTATNQAHTLTTDVAIGEILTYQVTLTIPEGTLPAAKVVDTMQSGLAMVGCTGITRSNDTDIQTSLGADFSSACTGANLTVAGGRTVTFNLGTITNSNTANATPETITITYKAVVLNSATNNRGTTLHNSAVLSWTGGSIAAATAPNVKVLEPQLTVTKTVDHPTGDAGDTIVYTVTISNDNNANSTTAFDVLLSDVVPTGMTYVSDVPVMWRQTGGTAIADSVTASGSPVTLTASWLSFAKNTSATFEFSATIDGTATPGTIFANTANATYTSLPGVVTTAQSSYDVTSTERTGNAIDPGLASNDYRASGSRNVTVPVAALAKTMPATNQASTTDPAVAVGEILTYQVQLTIPEGTTPAAVLTDTLPTGMALVNCASISASSGVSTNLAGGFPAACHAIGVAPLNPTVSGQNVLFDLGAITNANRDNGANNKVTITYDAVVLNVGGNTRGKNLQNSAVLSWTGGNSATEQADNVTVVEPIMTVAKNSSPASGDAGDLFTFTITVSNPTAANDAGAFEAEWKDTIPAGLSYVPASLQYVSGNVPDVNSLVRAGADLTAKWAAFARGTDSVLQYQATLDANVPSGNVYTNTANLTWTGLPGDLSSDQSIFGSPSTERTGSGVGANSYHTSATATVTVTQPAPVKTLVTTSEPGTSGSGVAIGEIARFRVAVTIPEGVTPNVTLVDAIPPGLTFLNDGTAKVAFVANGGGLTSDSIGGAGVVGDGTWGGAPTALIPPANITGGPFVDGADPTFNLGTLTNADNDAGAEEAVIEFNAVVSNVAGNVAGLPLADTVTMFKNGTSLATSSALSLTVAHPSISYTKTITTTPSDGGDTIVYQIAITNAVGTNSSPAYEFRARDTIDANVAVTNIAVAGPGIIWVDNSNAGSRSIDVTFTKIEPLDGQNSATITITGTVASGIEAGKLIPNTATSAWTSLPGDHGTPVGIDNATGSTTPGNPGDPTGERIDGGGPNDYRANSAADVALTAPSISKLGPTPATATIGGTTTFDISVTLPEGTTKGLAVVDTLPPGLAPVGYSVDRTGFSGTLAPTPAESKPVGSVGGDWTLTFGDTVVPADGLTTNNSFLVHVTAMVGNVVGNQSNVHLINHAGVRYTNPDSGSVTIAAPESPYVAVVEPVLKVVKNASTASPGFGAVVTYTLTVSHAAASNATAYDATLTDTLPAGLTYVGASLQHTGGQVPDTTNVAGNTITLTFGTLLGADTSTFTYQATVADKSVVSLKQILTNNARVTWSSLPGSPADERTGADGVGGALNDYAAATTAPVTVSGIDMAITKDDSQPQATAGAVRTYALGYVNNGNKTATGVTITETVPVGTTFRSAGSTVGWSCADGAAAATVCTHLAGSGTVAAGVGGSGSVNFAVTVVDPIPGAMTQISNTATIADDHSTNVDPTPADNTATDIDAIPQADLSLTKTVDDSTADANQVVVFTLIVHNSGPAQATNVRVTDVLPGAVTWVSDTGAGAYAHGTGIWTVGTLNSGASATLNISARVTASTPFAPFTNSAQVSHSDQGDPDSTPNNGVTTEDDYASVDVTPNIADLAVTKVVNVPHPDKGSDVIFTVVATNNSPIAAANTQVADLLPSGLTYKSSTVTVGTYTSGSGIWTVGTLVNGAPQTLTITATVTNTGSITNTATISGGPYDPDPSNNTASTATDQLVDLSVAKTVDHPTANVGTTVTFTITISNLGPGAAHHVVIHDAPPAGLTVTSISPSLGLYSALTGDWDLGTIPANGSVTATAQARVDGHAPMTNTASVKSLDEPQVSTANDSAGATVTPPQADLAVTKVVDEQRPNKGDPDSFTITVTNNGPDEATNVALSDVLPTGLTFTSAETSLGTYDSVSGTWTVGTLASGAHQSLIVHITATDPGDYTNTASVSHSDQYDPNPANDIASASLSTRVADIAVTKTAGNATPAVGTTVTFTITATNLGPDPATQLVLHDALPAGLSYVSSTAGHGAFDPTSGDWTVGDLAFGASVHLDIIAGVVGSGSIANTAAVTGLLQRDPDHSNDSATATIVVPPAADLSLAKTVDATTPDMGSNVTFTLTLTNHGPDVTDGVHVADLLPSGLTYVSNTPSVGAYDPSTGDWAVGEMAVGTSQTLAIVATVDVEGPITNTAEVASSSLPDPNSTPGNQAPGENDRASAALNSHGVADLSLTKRLASGTAIVGTTATYTLVVTNHGPDGATGVIVRDQLPAGLTYVSSGGGTYDPTTGAWMVGSLANGDAATLTITARVGKVGAIANVAEVVAADQRDPNSTPNDGVPSENDQSEAVLSASGATPPTTETNQPRGPEVPVGGLMLWVLGLAFAGLTLIASDSMIRRNRLGRRRP